MNATYVILILLMIEELQRFVKTAERSNITKTAETLFITQSALSQSIQRLERVLGKQSFVQKGKHLQLTPDGKTVLTISNKLLKLWDTMKDPAVRNVYEPVYTIGLFDNAALRLGKYFQKNITDETYTFELLIDSSSQIIKNLALGVVDIAICVKDIKNVLPTNIVLLETFDETLVPVSSRKFEGTLSDIPFILYNKPSNTRSQVDEIFIKYGIKPTVFAESTSTSFMKELAELGGGVALLPLNFIQQSLDQKILKEQRLPIQWQREYGIYINTESIIEIDHPIVAGLIDALQTN